MKNNITKAIGNLSLKVELYQEEITYKNYKNFTSFAFGGMILTGLISLVALICWGHVYFTREYCICFLHFVLCNLFIHFFLKNHIKYTLHSFYIALIPILTIGILMGTFLDSTSNAMTVMIMLCTLFMFITDKPLHIIAYISIFVAAFLFCSYLCKTPDMFIGDLVNLSIYLSIGISVNMLTLKDRISSAENYVLAKQKADIDALTFILNRGAGENIIRNLLKNGQTGSFFIIDIDDFKHVNDSYGHQIGDEVIRAVSQQLKTIFRDTDIVWRLGGDEFAVFAINLIDKEACNMRITQVQQELHHVKTSYPTPLDIRISVGCTICDTQDYEFDDIYKKSDDALYQAKHLGKNGCVIFDFNT